MPKHGSCHGNPAVVAALPSDRDPLQAVLVGEPYTPTSIQVVDELAYHGVNADPVPAVYNARHVPAGADPSSPFTWLRGTLSPWTWKAPPTTPPVHVGEPPIATTGAPTHVMAPWTWKAPPMTPPGYVGKPPTVATGTPTHNDDDTDAAVAAAAAAVSEAIGSAQSSSAALAHAVLEVLPPLPPPPWPRPAHLDDSARRTPDCMRYARAG
jgi:hypothetical protein